MEGDRAVTVLVSTELLAELTEWSPPVQVQVQHHPDLTPEYTMVFRTLRYPDTLEQLCERMHDAYEQAAVGAGWATNPASRVPWSDVPEANKAAMRAAVTALLEAIAAAVPGTCDHGVPAGDVCKVCG